VQKKAVVPQERKGEKKKMFVLGVDAQKLERACKAHP
jgi:hypothetical protein